MRGKGASVGESRGWVAIRNQEGREQQLGGFPTVATVPSPQIAMGSMRGAPGRQDSQGNGKVEGGIQAKGWD